MAYILLFNTFETKKHFCRSAINTYLKAPWNKPIWSAYSSSANETRLTKWSLHHAAKSGTTLSSSVVPVPRAKRSQIHAPRHCQGRSKWFFGVFRASVRDLAGACSAWSPAVEQKRVRKRGPLCVRSIPRTESVTTASKDVISDVVHNMRPGRQLVMGQLHIQIYTVINIRNHRLNLRSTERVQSYCTKQILL